MCTAISYKSKDVYFGRNLDLERSYNERVVITPRNYNFTMRNAKNMEHHYAMIGMATVVDDYPFEVLTNNPTFDYHRINLSNYMGLSVGPLNTQFSESLPLHNYSLGMGAMGLPGDFSSASRFVRAFFVKEHSISDENETSSVNQFFHILGSVAMPKGCVWTKNGYEYTRYTSCCNVNKGIYYYSTYDNYEITAVAMQDVDLEQSNLYTFELKRYAVEA